VLDALFAQDVEFTFEVVVVDSESRAADVALMRGYPLELRQIRMSEFGHGRTRNYLGKLAQGRVLLYLSQDAQPSGTEWMQRLVKPLEDESVAGVYARQIPRATADPLIRFFLARTYGDRPARRHVAHAGPVRIDDIFFSNVSSALRRDVWQRFPFRDVTMSEDQYWAHDVLRAGYDVVYEPTAQVVHSHNYSLATLYRRNRQSGASLRGQIADTPAAIARRGLGYIFAQVAYLLRSGCPHWLPYMLAYEATKAIGFSMGLRFGHEPF
jgi:rhamnosyltransferase